MNEPRRCPYCGEIITTAIDICHCMEPIDYGDFDDHDQDYDPYDEFLYEEIEEEEFI